MCHRDIEECTLNAVRSARGASVISKAAYWMQFARHVVPSRFQRLHMDASRSAHGATTISEIAHGCSLLGTWCRHDIRAAYWMQFARHVVPSRFQRLHMDAVRSARGAITISEIACGCSSLGTWCHCDITGCVLDAARSVCGAIVISPHVVPS